LQVESVAWISELKNTLSAVFYLGAAIAYLRFDQTRTILAYLVACGLFVLALLSKTVTGTLPGALLVIFWWQRGRLSWTKDVLPLVPLFLLGICGGMITAWWELKLNHCEGPEFTFTFVERILIAGRTVWFLFCKLFWPTNLTFIYPRWQINSAVWWQYLYPFSAVALLVLAWAVRHRTRAPLAAALLFGGTLFPIMGFFSLYTFRYSLVADHYQYLACLGIIALVSGGIAVLLDRTRGWEKMAGQTVCLALLAVLAVLSYQQCRMYADAETLYQTTIERNPECWMAHDLLGHSLALRGQIDEAIAQYRAALTIKPDDTEGRVSLGNILGRRGQVDEAIAHFQAALKARPDYAEAHNSLGAVLASRGRFDEAIVQYEEALQTKPNYSEALNNLGIALASRGKLEEAIARYQAALAIRPNVAEVHNNLGVALARHGQVDDAIRQYQAAVKIEPGFAGAYKNLGNALAGCGRISEAIEIYQKALNLAMARNDNAMADAVRAQLRACRSAAAGNKAQ
jgi:tetratricopeptide (TPR) repeat protein